MPFFSLSVTFPRGVLECAHNLPLYWVVARLNPTRLGRMNVFRVASHVPSPTVMVFDE